MAQNSECKQYIVNSFWGIITSTTWTAHIASISLTVLHIYSNVLRIDYIQYREQSNVFSVGLRVFLVLNMFWLLYLKMNDLEIHFKPKRCREDQNTWELLLIHYWITCAIIPTTPHSSTPPLTPASSVFSKGKQRMRSEMSSGAPYSKANQSI